MLKNIQGELVVYDRVLPDETTRGRPVGARRYFSPGKKKQVRERRGEEERERERERESTAKHVTVTA